MPNRFGEAHKAGNFWFVAAEFKLIRRIWIAALCAGLSPFGEARAQEDAPPTELLFQFQQPTRPGDSFSLRFPVPSGYQSAIVICEPPDASTGSGLPGSLDGSDDLIASIDWTRAFYRLLPTSESGVVCLNGSLPEEVSKLELSQSNIQLRIFLANRTTSDFLLSDPIPLGPLPSPDATLITPDQENTDTNHDVATDSILSVADMQFQPLPLTSVFGEGALGFSSHDQPIPIQGSGH